MDNKGARYYKEIEQYSHLNEDDAIKIFNHNSNGLLICNDSNKKIDDKYNINKLLDLKYDNNILYSNSKHNLDNNIFKNYNNIKERLRNRRPNNVDNYIRFPGYSN